MTPVLLHNAQFIMTSTTMLKAVILSHVTRCAAARNMSGLSQAQASTLNLVKEDVLAVLTIVVIFILGCWTWELLHREIFFVCCRYCCSVLRPFILLLFGVFVHPPIASVVLVTLSFWSVIFCSEVIVHEFKSRWLGVLRLKIGTTVWRYWNVAAVLRPSIYVLDVRYHPVMICDTSVPDDPFWPHHISTIFVVEWRRLSMIWTTVTIWQVSLLNGGKKNIHQFHEFWKWTDGRPFEYVCTRAECVDSFQSHGVIFIMMRRFEDRADDGSAMLFVYDTRLKKSAVYDMKLPDHRYRLYAISITCIGRLVGSNGSVEGWRIRILDAARSTIANQNFHLRACIINEVYELRQEAFLVRSEDIVFGRIVVATALRRVRTSRGHFGMHAKRLDETRSPIVFCSEATQNYALFRTFADLILMDNPLTTYIGSYPTWYPDGEKCTVCPLFLNDREAIISSSGGIVLRNPFRPSSLKYQAAKSLFHSNPQLRNQLTRNSFGELRESAIWTAISGEAVSREKL